MDLFKKLSQYQVQYLLIGGLAIFMHGIERATMDIDITPYNQDKVVAWAKSSGLKLQLPVPLKSLRNTALLKQWHQEKNLLAFALTTPEIAGVTINTLRFPVVNFAEMQQRCNTFYD